MEVFFKKDGFLKYQRKNQPSEKENFDLIGSIVYIFIYSLNSTTRKLLVSSSLEIEHGARLQQAASLLSSNLKKNIARKSSSLHLYYYFAMFVIYHF